MIPPLEPSSTPDPQIPLSFPAEEKVSLSPCVEVYMQKAWFWNGLQFFGKPVLTWKPGESEAERQAYIERDSKNVQIMTPPWRNN